MDLTDYARILIRRGWIMLLLAVLVAAGAGFLSSRQTPVYRSTQKVLIQPSRNDFGLTEATTRLLNSYAEYLRSEFIAQKVITTLQLDVTARDLLGRVTIAPVQISLLIQIDVDDENGDAANDIAREWGNELVRYRDEENQKVRREDQINARLQDVARYELNRPRPLINAAAGAVLGLLLGAVVIFVLEYMESSVVRHRQDLERVLDLPVLATMPDIEGFKK